jgi:hypothetical protein
MFEIMLYLVVSLSFPPVGRIGQIAAEAFMDPFLRQVFSRLPFALLWPHFSENSALIICTEYRQGTKLIVLKGTVSRDVGRDEPIEQYFMPTLMIANPFSV